MKYEEYKEQDIRYKANIRGALNRKGIRYEA